MKKYMILALTLITLGAQAEVQPLSSRCLGVKPICTPGTKPMCICESSYSFNCMWICAG